MKKINGFTITGLTLAGFKCFEAPTRFEFGETTFISADNGQGKSSIADAIAFAFAGTPFFGDRGLDRLHNRNAQEMSVSVDFVDNVGEVHNLTRSRKRDVTTITYDGINVRQSDLNTIFGDRDTFLSILNPLYFINVLGDSGKGLLEKLLPAVSHNDVLAALSDYSQNILAEQSLSSPETFIKNRRGELRELENAVIGYQSQKDLLQQQRRERAANVEKLRSELTAITAEIEQLTAVQNNFDRSAEESELATLRKQRAELLSGISDSDADNAVQSLTGEIGAVEKSVAVLESKTFASPYTAQIAETEAKLSVMRAEHSKVKASLNNTVVGYKCPACAVVITAENIDMIKSDLQQRLSGLVADGKVVGDTLAKIKADDTAAKREFDENKAKALAFERNRLNTLNQQLQELNIARELDAEDSAEQLTAVDNQIGIREHRLKYGNLMPEQVSRLIELEQSKRECETKIDALGESSKYDYTTLIEETQAEISRVKVLINEAIQYMTKRVELMLAGLKMNNTEIVLTEIIKTTGELKDCFRFSYDGRDYKCLSLSEKIRAGLEVSTLIQRLTGRDYPIFVDNAESVCRFGNVEFTGQVVVSRVVKGQALQVTHRERARSKSVA